jgi:hypothetical protein
VDALALQALYEVDSDILSPAVSGASSDEETPVLPRKKRSVGVPTAELPKEGFQTFTEQNYERFASLHPESDHTTLLQVMKKEYDKQTVDKEGRKNGRKRKQPGDENKAKKPTPKKKPALPPSMPLPVATAMLNGSPSDLPSSQGQIVVENEQRSETVSLDGQQPINGTHNDDADLSDMHMDLDG